MSRVKIYSTETCGYCIMAKRWLTENQIEYTEILLDNQEAISQFREECPGQRTVPQIFVLGELIEGGYDGLMKKKEEVLILLK